MEQERALLTGSPALLVLLTWLRENSKHVLLMRQTVGQTVRHKDRKTVDKETYRKDKETRDMDSDNMTEK